METIDVIRLPAAYQATEPAIAGIAAAIAHGASRLRRAGGGAPPVGSGPREP